MTDRERRIRNELEHPDTKALWRDAAEFLLSELDALRAENARLRQDDRLSRETGCWCDEHGTPCKGCDWRKDIRVLTEKRWKLQSELDAFRGENERLRIALKLANEAFEYIHDEWAGPMSFDTGAAMGQIADKCLSASMAIDNALDALDAEPKEKQ